MNATPTHIEPQSVEPQPVEIGGDRYEMFLKTVARFGRLDSTYDARDIVEVVFRTMRDVMTTAASDRVAAELESRAPRAETNVPQPTLASLWRDTNPLVGWLSRLRPPLTIDSEIFLHRIQQEGGVPKGTDAFTVTTATFSALKAELSDGCIREIADFLDGDIRRLWQRA
jgi:uncharacterized protein (DUF2267 family)